MSANNKQNFERRFGGVARLYGEKALERFTQSHIVVIGIGGVGSWVAEALARNAIGEITLIDMDVVAESNINRQLPAMSNTIGKNKIDVMAERIGQINAECKVNLIDNFIDADNIADLISESCDYVIDCIDNSRVKAALISWCKRNKVKVITLGGAGGQIDPTLIKLTDLSRTEHDPLLSKTRKLLRQNHGFTSNVKRRFGVPCVFSSEHLKLPTNENSDAMGQGSLTCSSGIGSSVMVTASFGFFACSYVLNALSLKALSKGIK